MEVYEQRLVDYHTRVKAWKLNDGERKQALDDLATQQVEIEKWIKQTKLKCARTVRHC